MYTILFECLASKCVRKKMEEELRTKIERWKIKSETFLKNDTRAFIVDANDQYYFCNILFVGEDTIEVQGFIGKLMNVKSSIYWADVIKLEEYRERE